MHVLRWGLHTLLFQLSQLLHEEGWIVSCRQLPSEPKFSMFVHFQKMVEIRGCNEHVSVTGEDDNACHASGLTTWTAWGIIRMSASSWSVSRSGCCNTSPFFIDCVGVDVSWPIVRLRMMRRLSGYAVKWSITYPFMSCFSLSLFAANGQRVTWHGLSSSPVTLVCSLYHVFLPYFGSKWTR